MKNLNYYNQIILKQDLINKFNYKNIKKIPQIKKILLDIPSKTNDLSHILSALAGLELLTSQKSTPITTKKPKIVLKSKKGSLSGCKIILKKNARYDFLCRLIIEIFPKIKQFTGFSLSKKLDQNTKILNLSLRNILNFPELEANYYYFTHLANLNITIITNATNLNELLFLLKSFKIPFN